MSLLWSGGRSKLQLRNPASVSVCTYVLHSDSYHYARECDYRLQRLNICMHARALSVQMFHFVAGCHCFYDAADMLPCGRVFW